MPDGAISQELENLPIFRDYVAANVERWYRYINGPRGREAKNGDVRLVVGCDKATSWGMATLSNMTQHNQLKFKPLDAQSSSSGSCGYTWEHSGTADVKVGPDQKEINELRTRSEDEDDSPTGGNFLNQCLFVRTLNITLGDEDWELLNRGIGVGVSPSSIAEHGTGTPRSPTYQNPLSESNGTQMSSSTSGGFGTQRGAGNGSAVESTSLGMTANRLTISVPPTATVSQGFEQGPICLHSTLYQSRHPSRILNETLLKKVGYFLLISKSLIIEPFSIDSDCKDGDHSRRRLVFVYSRGMPLSTHTVLQFSFPTTYLRI